MRLLWLSGIEDIDEIAIYSWMCFLKHIMEQGIMLKVKMILILYFCQQIFGLIAENVNDFLD